jgi:hypothetical protein
MNQDRFASLVELQQAHDDLSRTQASPSRAAPDPARVADFIRRAVATGTVLDGREERSVAQSLTNFWAKRLKASTRGTAPADGTRFQPASDTALATEALPRPSPAKIAAPADARPFSAATDSTLLSDSALAGDSALAAEKLASRAADCELIEDTLLAEYNADTLGESAAAADRVIESLTEEDADLARRLVLRLVRLRPEGKKFDAIPTSRAAMQTYGEPASVDRIINQLAVTGVFRVTPGENPLADRVGLRSVDLRAVWPRLNEWLDARVAFRDRASAPLPERGISRFPDYVVTWLTKQLASVSRFIVRLRRRVVPTAVTEISDRDREDAELYHDHNARESEYLRRLRDRRRRINEANRVLVWLATLFFVVAIVGWWLARSQATLATENEHVAHDRLRLSNLRYVCRAWAEVITARNPDQREIAKYRWNSLVKSESIRDTFARDLSLDQLGSVADEANQQQNALPGRPAAFSTADYHQKLMEAIRNLRNELVGRPTVRPSLEMTRKLSFDTVGYCIENTNRMLLVEKRLYGEAVPYIREFWEQYWGEMILVEGDEVANAMVTYGAVLNKLRDHAVPSRQPAAPADVAKPPPSNRPPTSKPSDAKGSAPPTNPAGAKGDAPPPPPAAAPVPSPKPVLPEAPPSEKESELLEQLKGLPLDQAERLMRRMREQALPKDLLDELRDAYEQLRAALTREGSKALEAVLQL